MADFVFLHGTTQGPKGWERLTSALGEVGHRSFCPDLITDESFSSEAYASEVARQVGDAYSTPIVVAHSGAGLLLSATARRLGASHQVWLAAFVPDPEQSLHEEVTADPAAVMNEEWLGKDPTADPVLAAYFLFHDCDLATLQWALTTLRLFVPLAAYGERIELSRDIPSTHVLARGDRTLLPEWSRRVARERLGVEPIEVESGHCPHVSRPLEIAAILDGLSLC